MMTIFCNKPWRYFIYSLLVASLFSWQQQAYAQSEAIGEVVWVQGQIKATQPNNNTRVLKRRSPFFLRDTLTTDANSAGEIIFTDQSIISLRPNTEIKIAAYKARKNGTQQQAGEQYIVNLAKGGFRTITGLIAKDNPPAYQIDTPTATIGVRGTELSLLLASSAKNVTGAQRRTVSRTHAADRLRLLAAVYKGTIQVSNQAGTLLVGQGAPTSYAAVDSLASQPQALKVKPAEFKVDVVIKPATLSATDVAGLAATTLNATVNTAKTPSRGAVGCFTIN